MQRRRFQHAFSFLVFFFFVIRLDGCNCAFNISLACKSFELNIARCSFKCLIEKRNHTVLSFSIHIREVDGTKLQNLNIPAVFCDDDTIIDIIDRDYSLCALDDFVAPFLLCHLFLDAGAFCFFDFFSLFFGKANIFNIRTNYSFRSSLLLVFLSKHLFYHLALSKIEISFNEVFVLSLGLALPLRVILRAPR